MSRRGPVKKDGPGERRTVTRRAFLGKGGMAALGGALGAFGVAGGMVYSHDLETTWIDVTQLRLRLPRLPAAFQSYRIVLLSDLHLDDLTEPSYLAKVVRLVNEREPDLIS